MQSSPNQLNGFARFLVNKKFLPLENVEAIQSEMKHSKNSWVEYLSQNDLPADRLAEAIKDYFAMPFFNLDRYEIKNIPRNLLPAELIQKYSILPLYHYGSELWLGLADPISLDINEINFIAGIRCKLIIVEIDKLNKIINEIYATHVSHGLANTTLDLENFYIDENISELAQLESNSSPVVQYIHKILAEGINKKSSDIHFEPYENIFRVRYRIDGILYEVDNKSSKLAIKNISQSGYFRKTYSTRWKIQIHSETTSNF
jgi:type IV pilus assembly protein PilB